MKASDKGLAVLAVDSVTEKEPIVSRWNQIHAQGISSALNWDEVKRIFGLTEGAYAELHLRGGHPEKLEQLQHTLFQTCGVQMMRIVDSRGDEETCDDFEREFAHKRIERDAYEIRTYSLGVQIRFEFCWMLDYTELQVTMMIWAEDLLSKDDSDAEAIFLRVFEFFLRMKEAMGFTRGFLGVENVNEDQWDDKDYLATTDEVIKLF